MAGSKLIRRVTRAVVFLALVCGGLLLQWRGDSAQLSLDSDDLELTSKGSAVQASSEAHPPAAAQPPAAATAHESEDEEDSLDEDHASHGRKLEGITPKDDSLFSISWTSVPVLENWLIEREANYGGRINHVQCKYSAKEAASLGLKVSQKGRSECSGGDRMAQPRTKRGVDVKKQHGYGICYAKVIDAYGAIFEEMWRERGKTNMEAAEAGVLSGSGVAIWEELFQGAPFHAFDRYLVNIRNNTPFLKSRGAFSRKGLPAMHSFDQADPRFYPRLDDIMMEPSSKFFYIIDDASHFVSFTLNTHKYFEPYFDLRGAYIIEDINIPHGVGDAFREGLDASWDMWICPDPTSFWVLTKKPQDPGHAAQQARAMAKLQKEGFWRYPWPKGGAGSPVGDAADSARPTEEDEQDESAAAPLPEPVPPAPAEDEEVDEESPDESETDEHSHKVEGVSPKGDDSLVSVEWQSVSALENWLIEREANYGGRITNVPCRYSSAEASKIGVRTAAKGKKECSGGDRMAQPKTKRGVDVKKQHGYGICYAKVIDAFIPLWQEMWLERGKTDLEAAEAGVLSGSGVAIWEELFQGAPFHAFDRFLVNIRNNTPFLESRGAFARKGRPHMHDFDQANPRFYPPLDEIMMSPTSKFFYVIDDASHYVSFTLNTFKYFEPYLDLRGAYIVEDINIVHGEGDDFRRGLAPEWNMWICPDPTSFWVLSKKPTDPRHAEQQAEALA
eukprot:CAMPEP_0178444126 /NCGR_PEP_ID=MMETSP0689_2-20121128/39314_1 /TAXON_ID=160604 /ORGANISM="Amphidinium massartii, Strain CS-259" /LENGTH=728 /DNA_ID=CAMNT_0020068283 /DNA_START=71 /DNA_END=2253 /DNA_ORIENTATION=+